MKKIFYLVIFAIFIILPNHVFAQKIGLGVKGGLNLATTTFDVGKAGGDKEIFVGLNAGAYAYIKLNKLFALQTEINYLQQGYQETGVITITYLPSQRIEKIGLLLKTNYNYLQVPILLRTNFDLKKFKFWGNAGVYTSYLLNSRWTFNPAREDPPNIVKTEGDNATYVNNIDFGLCLGAGIGYKLGIGYATFDARYNYGLSEIGNEKAQSLRGYLKQEHRNLVFSVGYLVEF